MLQQLDKFSRQLKKLEDEITENEERYRLIAEFAYDWEYWQDTGGNFIYVSPSCTSITGYKPEEFFADRNILKKIIHPEDWHQWETHAHVKLADGDVEPLEFRIVRKNGELRWVHHVCRTVYSREGEKRGIRGSNRDITEKKKMQEELKVLRGFLAICSSCKMIRDKNGKWVRIEKYIKDHSEVDFTHGICPDCARKLYPELYTDLETETNDTGI
jgi:PAS domain S-box-containing protein